jgi:hypothetical protein
VFLLSSAAELTHIGALLRRFGFEVCDLGGVPGPEQISDRQRCDVQLIVVDEALCTVAGVDPVARLAGTLPLSSVVIAPRRPASPRVRRPEPSDRCRYLSPDCSPIDFTL